MLALRRFISDASFDEARRNLDSNESVVRVAAVSKFEDLPRKVIQRSFEC